MSPWARLDRRRLRTPAAFWHARQSCRTKKKTVGCPAYHSRGRSVISPTAYPVAVRGGAPGRSTTVAATVPRQNTTTASARRRTRLSRADAAGIGPGAALSQLEGQFPVEGAVQIGPPAGRGA